MNKKYVLITGASSGIGQAFAENLASQGYHFYLTGRNKERLKELSEKLVKTWAIEVKTFIADFSNQDQWRNLMAELLKLPPVYGLVNNAGYGQAKTFLEDNYESQSQMLRVHMDGPTELCHYYLPFMIENKGGFIINLASMAGFICSPSAILYTATKAYLIRLSESLHVMAAVHGIKVQALCPGMTFSDFHNKLGLNQQEMRKRGPLQWLTAKKTVELSLKKLGRKVVYTPGFRNRLMLKFLGLLPRGFYYRLTIWAFRAFKYNK
ncbi:MAG: SDR family NAD(P)-dependent oxidoreductase [Spirochaetales bacterium]|nr:SDR family NAD(P)-dependent oxidoreductase [Spirochaetales bacterium]